MADEAVIIELFPNSNPIRYTCSNGSGISAGALLKVVDPRTVSGANTNDAAFAGIACSEKVVNDGSTDIGVYASGIFDLTAGDVITAGQLCSLSGSNRVKRYLNVSGGAIESIVGKALETSTTGEVIAVAVGVY